MTAPIDPTSLLIPITLSTLLDPAEERHAAAMHDGDFDLADQWRRFRDSIIDLVYGSGAAK